MLFIFGRVKLKTIQRVKLKTNTTMCTITGKSDLKTATGYKYAIERDGNFYSPYSGCLYKVGKVTPVTLKQLKARINKTAFGWVGHNPGFKGKTAVICDINSARTSGLDDKYAFTCQFGREIKMSLIKMEISGHPILTGYFIGDIFIGDTILSIEKVCDL